MSDTNEKGIRAWAKNGGKRDVGKVGGLTVASVGTVIAVMHLFPAAVPGYSDAQDAKAKMDTVVAVETRVTNVEKSVTEFRSEYREDQRELRSTLFQISRVLGVPTSAAPKTDTVFVVDSTRADSTNPR